MSRIEIEVLEANTAFYAAFAAGDAAAMETLWAREAPVTCVHPGWDALRGREEVMASWRAVLGGQPPPVTCTGASAHVLGETAFVICQERLPGARLVATNVFVREAGAWRLVHHQAGALARAPREAPPPGGTLN
jgi:ketosteroid isomerase-like protein